MNRVDGVPEVPLGCGRFVDFYEVVNFNGIDWSTSSFSAQIRLRGDVLGDPLATLQITAPAFADDKTTIVMSLARTLVFALPFGPEPGADAEFRWDLTRNLAGARALVMFGKFTVYAGITR
jgi:hypothetical protein